jgi:hypothetical protein
MIAPDPQQETGSAISQENLEVRLLLFGLLCGHSIDLGMQRSGSAICDGLLL